MYYNKTYSWRQVVKVNKGTCYHLCQIDTGTQLYRLSRWMARLYVCKMSLLLAGIKFRDPFFIQFIYVKIALTRIVMCSHIVAYSAVRLTEL
jgi:hypothetical protein